MSSICLRDSMIPGIGGWGSISQPRIQAGFFLLSFATKERGGAPSVAALLASGAWQEMHERMTRSRPASALPAGAASAGTAKAATAPARIREIGFMEVSWSFAAHAPYRRQFAPFVRVKTGNRLP